MLSLKYKLLLLLLLCTPSLFSATKLIILGSGTPNPDPNRGGSAYAVLVNEVPYLIDFGPGVIRNGAALSSNWNGEYDAMNVDRYEHAFLTHIHSDHTAGLSDLMLTPWVMGRKNKLKLFGPAGLDKMASNIIEAYQEDINYRIYGTQPANKTGYQYKFTRLFEGVVYKDKNIMVEAFQVPHGSFNDAYGFKFTTADKVIVFSGDTGPSEKVLSHAKNADILVHEVYSNAGFQEKTKDWQIYHQAHHTSTIEVGKIANKAKPKTLVLSHILFWGSTPEDILNEVKTQYSGTTVIAEDLMVIE